MFIILLILGIEKIFEKEGTIEKVHNDFGMGDWLFLWQKKNSFWKLYWHVFISLYYWILLICLAKFRIDSKVVVDVSRGSGDFGSCSANDLTGGRVCLGVGRNYGLMQFT